MIVLDNDVLVKLGGADPGPDVVEHMKQYRDREWTVPAIVAFEFFRACDGRAEMERARRRLTDTLDRIVPFGDGTALEAAYLDDRLRTHGVALDPVDLLNLATAHEADGTFVTHDKGDFEKSAVRELASVDVIHTA